MIAGRGWVALAAGLGLAAIVVTIAMAADGGLVPAGLVASTLDWQPGQDAHQPWRPWTSAWVHWSWPHLVVNLAGAAVVAGVGWRARAGVRETVAWFMAWPLTQALLDLIFVGTQAGAPSDAHFAAHLADHLANHLAGVPDSLTHYGGLSGVLHAGVLVLGLSLLFPSRRQQPPAGFARRHRLVGLALCGGTVAKVLLEAPWDLALRPSSLLGIGIAPVAHACGIAAAIVSWLVVRVGSGALQGASTAPTPGS